MVATSILVTVVFNDACFDRYRTTLTPVTLQERDHNSLAVPAAAHASRLSDAIATVGIGTDA
jgi:hypothetical protein